MQRTIQHKDVADGIPEGAGEENARETTESQLSVREEKESMIDKGTKAWQAHRLNGIRVYPGKPSPLGATWDGMGVNFALYSRHADNVELLLFDHPLNRQVFVLKWYFYEFTHYRQGRLYTSNRHN